MTIADVLLEAKRKLAEARKNYALASIRLSEAGCDVDALMEAEIAQLRVALEVFADERNWWQMKPGYHSQWKARGEPWRIAQEALGDKTDQSQE